jgi:hypothetical protein
MLTLLSPVQREEYEEIIRYCETRVTSDEGVPAIIALDDLTRPGESLCSPAASDEGMNMLLAEAAMQFTALYEQSKKDDHYPAIAFAMSAAAEKCFVPKRPSSGLEALSYREATGLSAK